MTTKAGLASKVSIIKVEKNGQVSQGDLVATEEPLQIRLEFEREGTWSSKDLMVTMRSPGDDFDLAMGFLFSEQVIQSEKEVMWMRYCQKVKKEEVGNVLIVRLAKNLHFDTRLLERNFFTHSSCGVCGKTAISAVNGTIDSLDKPYRQILDLKTLLSLPENLLLYQTGFKFTGGLHAAVLFEVNGKIISMREDVGRHNALDKLIGAALKEGIDLSKNKIVLLSGRISFEMVQKAVRAKIPVLAAIGAPTHLAVALAREMGQTLIGFLKADRCNIYTHPIRIKTNSG